MAMRFDRFVFGGTMALAILLCAQRVVQAAPADLSGWVGVANTLGTNNFTSTATTAGGDFQERYDDGLGTMPSLADTSLVGGPLGFNTSLTVSGTVVFDEPAFDVNPGLDFGWYDSTAPLTRRLVLAPADTQTVGDLRWVIIASGDFGSNQIAVLKDSGGSAQIPDGTYSFNLSYDSGTGMATANIGAFSASFAVFSLDVGIFDRFGYLQFAGGDPNDTDTFSLQVSNINYTGETQGSPLIPGDFDSDGDVDGADFVAWQTNFPTASGGTLATGDADADGDVDGADFVVWQTNFPTSPGPGVTSIPEPASLVIAFIGITSAACARWRRCQA